MDDKLDEEDTLILASILKYMDHLTLWCAFLSSIQFPRDIITILITSFSQSVP